jgi:hypothetical protein
MLPGEDHQAGEGVSKDMERDLRQLQSFQEGIERTFNEVDGVTLCLEALALPTRLLLVHDLALKVCLLQTDN